MANITLYTTSEDRGFIDETISKSMDDYSVQDLNSGFKIKKQGFLLKKEICEIYLKERQVGEEANYFTQGFVGYLAKELHGDASVKGKILYFSTQVKTIISFQVKDSEIEKLDFMSRIFMVAEKIGGIIFLQSGYLLDALGNEIATNEGEIAVNELEIELLEVNVNEFATSSVENQGRRTATIEKLDANGIPYALEMPLLPDSKQVNLKNVEEIARRASVLLILIQFVREVLDDKEQSNIKASRRITEVYLNRFGVKKNLTPSEAVFLQQESYDQQQLIDKMWLYEAAWLLLWSIHIIDDLKEPIEICDVESLLNLLTSYTTVSELIEDAEMRSSIDILERMDENYLYHWTTVNSRISGVNAPAGLEEGVVMERQRAFNWLTQLQDEQWDDVTLNT